MGDRKVVTVYFKEGKFVQVYMTDQELDRLTKGFATFLNASQQMNTPPTDRVGIFDMQNEHSQAVKFAVDFAAILYIA